MQIKVSTLPEATGLSSGSNDLIMIIQGGQNKKLTLADLFTSVKSDVVINPDGTPNLTFIIKNQTGGNLVYTDSTRVGINTNAPEALLHVLGDIKCGSENVAGLFINSDEEVVIPPEIDEQAILGLEINPNVQVSRITTTQNSAVNALIPISTPKKNQTKTITLVNEAVTPEGYFIVGDIVMPNANAVKLTRAGHSVTLLGISDTQWVVTSLVGAELIQTVV